jgi:hypothetical protein
MVKVTKDYDQVSGIFNSEREIESLLSELRSRGLRDEDISVLMSEQTRDKYVALREESKSPEGATVGSVSGGILGAILGGLSVVGNVFLPGIGLLVAGPLVGALSGAAIGTATGGLIGALVGAGIPEHEAKFFEDAIKEEGNVFIIAHVPHEDTGEIKNLFNRYGARSLKVHH